MHEFSYMQVALFLCIMRSRDLRILISYLFNAYNSGALKLRSRDFLHFFVYIEPMEWVKSFELDQKLKASFYGC